MSIKSKSWFFDVPNTSAYKRFRQYNRPDEIAFRHLFDSVAMKLEVGDTASETQQGLVKLVTNANAIARSSASAGQMQTVVKPHQLPLMVGVVDSVDTVADTIDTAVEGWDGMKLTPVNGGSSTRMDFKLEWDPYLINNGQATTPVVDTDASWELADKMIILDGSDSNKPKLVNISEIVGGGGIWSQSSGTITPITADSNLDLGAGSIASGNITLENSAARTITVKQLTGGPAVQLTLSGGDHTTTSAGKLVLKGGASAVAAAGGDVHIYGGGTNGGTVGNTFLNWSEGGSAIGRLGILSDIDAAYDVKVGTPNNGVMWIDGNLRLTVSITSTQTELLGITSGNLITKRTSAQVNESLFGSASDGDVLYYNSGWQRLALPAADAYLKMNFSAKTPQWDTALSSADEKVKVSGTSSTALYLYGDGADGALRMYSSGGLKVDNAGDYIQLALDHTTLDEITVDADYAGLELWDGFVTSVHDVGEEGAHTQKFDVAPLVAGTKNHGWINITQRINSTNTLTYRIPTVVSLVGNVMPGMAIKYKCQAYSDVRYATVSDVQATHIDIDGAPMGTGTNQITWVCVGHPSKVVVKEIILDKANYNNTTTYPNVGTKAIEELREVKDGLKWYNKTAFLTGFTVIHTADDSTVAPKINMRVGDPADTSDYICTSNTNKGLAATTTENKTVVDINPTYYEVNYGDNIEVKVDDDSGTGDAENLSVFAVFVMK